MFVHYSYNDAAQDWVQRMNAIDREIVEKLMDLDPFGWEEVTTPSVGDRVQYSGLCESGGEITDVKEEDGEYLYRIKLDSGSTAVDVTEDEFYVRRDEGLPMWGTMWSFGDSCDDDWLSERGGIRLMSSCGFRIYYSEDYGYFFGIDGCGYDFYEDHWIPLYKARGMRWHSPAVDAVAYMIKHGTQHTMSGNYHFEFADIEKMFCVKVNDEFKEAVNIVSRNASEVSDLEVVDDFDFMFYTRYCPYVEEDEE